MKISPKRQHSIDLIFPIALFFVFAASALMVLILAADLYSSAGKQQQKKEEIYTPLSYLAEKIRQNDTGGAIRIIRLEDTDCLSIAADYDGTVYYTYIYAFENMLKELFVPEHADVSPGSGTDLMPVQDLQMEELSPGLFRFTAADSDHQQVSVIIAQRSQP